MTLVQLLGVSKIYSTKRVLDNVNFQVNEGNKIGIIGLNGAGKTTLLKIIMGETESSSGKVSRVRNLRVAYVPQMPEISEGETVYDASLSMHAVFWPIKRRLSEIEMLMDSRGFENSPEYSKIMEEYSKLLSDFEIVGGYSLEGEIEKCLARQGLKGVKASSLLSDLSAGERKISQLAAAVAVEPNFLVLDEPTNHIDVEASEAVDKFIEQYVGAIVYVTHDRYLLNRIAGRIAEVRDGKIIEFSGTYDDYIDFRIEHFEAEVRKYKATQKKRARLRDSMLKLKSKGFAGSDKAAKRAKVMERRIESLDMKKPESVEDSVNISIERGLRGGSIVLRASDLFFGYGENPVLSDVNLEIVSGERIGIVGANGSGKTSLLNCFLGYVQPQRGNVWIGPSIKVGYFAQTDINLDDNTTIYDTLNGAGCKSQNEAYGLMKKWLFKECSIDREIGTLSGGEKKKIQLIAIMLAKPNLLVLDEPTDNLDMASREGLERAVSEFDGTIIAVSHDRYFLDSVTDKTMVIKGGKIKIFSGSYSANFRRFLEY